MAEISLDPYIVDVLMPDLAGHDRKPSAFLVYLYLWRQCQACARKGYGVSYQTMAIKTGLSRAGTQAAIRHLQRRELIRVVRGGPTAIPVYSILTPWRR